MYKIVSAHWSSNPNDSHSEDDEDVTYAVVDDNKRIVEMFTKLGDAEKFVEKITVQI